MAAFAERRQRRRERMEQLIERAARTHRLTEEEITRLLAAPEAEEAEEAGSPAPSAHKMPSVAVGAATMSLQLPCPVTTAGSVKR